MQNNITKFAIILMCILLQACGFNAYKAHGEKAKQTKEDIDDVMQFLYSTNAAEYIDEPPSFLRPKHIENRPYWLTKKDVDLNIPKKAELSILMARIRESIDIYPLYQDGTSTTQVSLSVENASLHYILESISAQTDLHYEIHDRNIVWSKNQSKTFHLQSLPGTRKFGMGTGEASSGSDGTSEDSTSGKIKSGIEDYAQLSNEGMEFITSISKGVQEIIGEEFSVLTNKHSTSLTVIAPPSKVRLVEKYVNQENDDLNKQAILMVKILNFQSKNSNSSGVDWNLVKTATNGTASLGNSFVNSIETGSFLKFAPTFGGLDGSEILVSALQQQGKVSVSNELPIALLNYRPSRFKYNDSTSFVSNISNTESNETGQLRTELEKDIAEDGYTMYALGKILDDNILLQLSSELSALKDFDETQVDGITIKSPQYTQSLFAQTNSIKFGETLIANAFIQSHSNESETSMFKVPWLGGNSGETTTNQTIVLITPAKI
ncbi:hypothetical protein A1QO_05465 [Vibrio genomosp. F10 str. ZF-129]|uniref:Type II and III secretion system protein n=1 Tax=Vibrio genomosp. F10 str. ZF-129 TaxID=1187848 RepID=A0A1E5BGS8_9VIBR|nr:hypothetical protein [Vibrio genomosp. F10]OEE35717.1 hypothetical protein A1QO_05465 [Vibrio genomosp. F10 str. ZF-129]